MLAESDEEAEEALQRAGQPVFPMRAGIRDALLKLDSRNVGGEARTPNVGGILPTTFIGSPDTIVEQVRRCREQVGAGVIDLMFQNPGGEPASLIRSLELFGKEVLPRIRKI
jgi:alkanesulfonate monooxygenase SsuD/methylene tetrahydromethanopterin reductase-like flavin-dependent oxidoreductase (luciferase family)